jgi:hypothetical protein
MSTRQDLIAAIGEFEYEWRFGLSPKWRDRMPSAWEGSRFELLAQVVADCRHCRDEVGEGSVTDTEALLDAFEAFAKVYRWNLEAQLPDRDDQVAECRQALRYLREFDAKLEQADAAWLGRSSAA